MKSRSRFMAIVISILVGGLIFALLYTFTKPAMPRLPSPNYSTLEEEYIDAIETKTWLNESVTPYEIYLKFLSLIFVTRIK